MNIISEKWFRYVVLLVALMLVLSLVALDRQSPGLVSGGWRQTIQRNNKFGLPQPKRSRIGHLDNSRTKLLCMIFTTSEGWDTKARAVNNTWASRCYRAVFFYSKVDRELPGAVALDVPEGRDHLTNKTRAALLWSYHRYGDQVDWYLKADDDAYFVMENLEAFLGQFDLNYPHYVGKNNQRELKTGYASGGAGYVLNTLATELVLNGSKSHPGQCKTSGGIEDLDIGDCLRAQSVYLDNSLDDNKRQRFHCNDPMKVMSNHVDTYYITKNNYTYGKPENINWMMSPELISFHYVTPENMYVYDYLLYDVRRIISKP